MDEKASLSLALNINSLTTPIDTLDTNSPRSQALANPPPPINWSTRPRQTTTNNVLQESSGAAGGSPMHSRVDDALEQLLRHLAQHPRRRFGWPQSELQDGCDEAAEWQELAAAFARLSTSNNPSSTAASFRRDEPSELQDSTATLMRVSTSYNPTSSTAALFRAHTPPGSSATCAASFQAHTPPSSSATRPSSPKKGSKYYTIIVGKCTGVYYGVWYVNI